MKPSGCVCPGDILTYKCTIMGTNFGITVWTGSTLMSSCPQREIILLHRYFLSAAGACNNEAIVARSLSIEGNNYTSQLNVTVTSDIAGTTVVCGYDNHTHYIIQNLTVIPSPGLSPCIGVDTTN